MPDDSIPTGPSSGPDDECPPKDIADLLRRVPAEDEAQLAAFALLQAYRREALCAVATCLDRAAAERAIARARSRLKLRLLSLLDGQDSAGSDPLS